MFITIHHLFTCIIPLPIIKQLIDHLLTIIYSPYSTIVILCQQNFSNSFARGYRFAPVLGIPALAEPPSEPAGGVGHRRQEQGPFVGAIFEKWVI